MSMIAGTQPNMKQRAVKRQAWKALESHYKIVSKLHLRELFADDPERGTRLAVEALGLYPDRFGAAQGIADEVRVRTGPGGCGCKEVTGESVS